MNILKIKNKLVKLGNSHYVCIPSDFVPLVKEAKEYHLKLVLIDEGDTNELSDDA